MHAKRPIDSPAGTSVDEQLPAKHVELVDEINSALARFVGQLSGALAPTEATESAPSDSGDNPESVALAQTETDDFVYVLTRFPKSARGALSPREKEIVALVAEGLPNKIIALRLGIKPASVATYLRRAYSKLNTNSRAVLALRSLLT